MSADLRVVALAGGTGAAKLLRGLVRVVDAAAVTVIGNTGDDADVWGLHVSPDLDTVTYALGGALDLTRGWGRTDETFHCLDAMAALGADTAFARPQGLDRVWIRFGFIPVPETALPAAFAGRPGAGLYGWRGGSALWTLRDTGHAAA